MDQKLKDIMTTLPVSVEDSTSLKDALKLMKSKGISHIIVIDGDKKLSGIISKQDIINRLYQLISRTTGKTYTALELENHTVSDLMTKDPYALKESDTAKDAAKLIVNHHINCIPVINSSNTIIGVVTSYDILKHSINT